MSELASKYLEKYQGSFYGVLRWHQLDELWQVIQENQSSYFVYQVGEVPPQTTCSPDQLHSFINNINVLLREEHKEKYCGIVYADDKKQPSFIKIYDPNNLGSSCGSGLGPKPFPGWTISIDKPEDLKIAFPAPQNRKRWWKKIFSS